MDEVWTIATGKAGFGAAAAPKGLECVLRNTQAATDLWAGRHCLFSQQPAVMTGHCSFTADLVMFT